MTDIGNLLEQATRALQNAYAPYSGYRVGAALQADDGQIFAGCNMENASFGLTLCAERAAFCNAVSEGKRNFTAIAIVAASEGMPFPCGACLQVMAEFCEKDFRIIIASAKSEGDTREHILGDLLASPFTMQDKD